MEHSGFIDTIIPFLIQYRYYLILPISVIEGPIISIVVGFLVSLGYFNFWTAYLVLVIGDLIGDSLYYALGRYGRNKFLQKLGWLFGLNEDRLDRIERYIYGNLNKTFIFGKFAHGLGSIVWFTHGMIRVPFGKFLFANAVTTGIKSLILVVVGYFFGWAYNTFDYYLRYASLLFFVVFIVFYVFLIKSEWFNRHFNNFR